MALDRKEFSLYYQPKIELTSRKIVAMGKLIRWNNKELGFIPPDKFIPIAEETGLIIPIGEWVLETACKQLKAWEQEGLTGIEISVNLSACQFYDPHLVSSVKRIIQETGIHAASLELEITESMTMDMNTASKIIRELKDLGVKISLDDFGTGYSTYNYLKHFPIDYLKVDKTFINDIERNNQSINIVKAFLLTAKAIGFKVVAEGVETKEQLDLLEQLECDEVQGYYITKPLPSDEITQFMKKW
jgi:EAL domain-containing protein (putative c-di-GMP-specific phosphodiesterase class I)